MAESIFWIENFQVLTENHKFSQPIDCTTIWTALKSPKKCKKQILLDCMNVSIALFPPPSAARSDQISRISIGSHRIGRTQRWSWARRRCGSASGCMCTLWSRTYGTFSGKGRDGMCVCSLNERNLSCESWERWDGYTYKEGRKEGGWSDRWFRSHLPRRSNVLDRGILQAHKSFINRAYSCCMQIEALRRQLSSERINKPKSQHCNRGFGCKRETSEQIVFFWS